MLKVFVDYDFLVVFFDFAILSVLDYAFLIVFFDYAIWLFFAYVLIVLWLSAISIHIVDNQLWNI